MNDQSHDSTRTPPSSSDAERGLDAGKLATAVLGLGATWARYGLAVGRASLSATAATLESTGELLGRLSRTIEQTAAQVRDRDRTA